MVWVNPKIFKAYDIRGIYPYELNGEIAYRLGQAFVKFIEPRQIVVGYDMRLSSSDLFNSLTKGINDAGTDVVDIGMVGVDVFYFACGNLNLPGIMITASHNPKEYNGFKMVKQMPHLIGGGTGMEEIRDLIFEGKFKLAKIKGKHIEKNIWPHYVKKVISFIDRKKIKPLKIVIDAGNGMAGMIVNKVFVGQKVKIIPMYFEPDGNFPNHEPNPLLEENRQDIIRRLKKEKADLGFAFDGDADRFFVFDHRGEFVPGDFLTALLAQKMLKHSPGSPIIYDARASWAVPDLVKAAGGVPLVNRVGHVYIKRRMEKEGAVFGGEVSGHYYFRDFYNADSAIIAALMVLEIISENNKRLYDLVRPLRRKYFISGEINFEVRDKQAVIERLKERYSNAKISYIDGISIDYPDWHFNVRPSNTEPLIRLNLEARSKKMMEEKKKELIELIKKR